MTAEARWRRGQEQRTQFLDIAVDCSSLTIPTLIPDTDLSSGSRTNGRMNSLYQGAGARGVNNLAAKLLLALYPPSQPFFRLTLDRRQLAAFLEKQGGKAEEMVSQIDEGLAQVEHSILLKMDKLGMRSILFETLKHLLCGGNGLLYVGDDNVRFYGLRSFCIERDPEGNWSEIVIKEEVDKEFLPPGTYREGTTNSDPEDEHFCDVYTYVDRDPTADPSKEVSWHQEYEGKKIPGTAGFSPLATCPWVPLRLHRVAGEGYGRGLVEEVLGDLQSLESLSQAIVEGSLIAAHCKFLVNPNGVTRADVIANAANGACVPGNANDVEPLVIGKQQDFSTALQCMQLIERRLQFTFLLNEAMQRDAERVTAEEVRQMAEQLEQTLGGIYSILSQEMQQPLIRRVVAMMEKAGEIDSMPGEFISPEITTGLDAIGRGNDRARLTQFLQTIAGAMGPDFLQYINPTELITRFAASDGIDTKGLVKSQQQLQQEQAIAQKVQLEQQLAATALNGASQGAQGPPTAPPPGAPVGAPGGNGATG